MKKIHKNPKGGLSAKGRAHFNSKGANLKPPVKKGTNPRRVSFAARFCWHERADEKAQRRTYEKSFSP